MKTKIVLLAALLCAGSALAGDFKVGVVDTERVLRESVPAIKAEKKIEKEFSGRDQEIKKNMKQAKDLQLLLDKDAASLSEVDRRSKERELNALNVNLQRMQREAIQAIAESDKYDLILQEAVYRNPKIDITDKVIKNLASDKADSK
jgi:outer membrane protein